MNVAPGCAIVVDSNVLLQCRRPDELGWKAEVGETARLMLPLRVVEEVDSKKYGSSPRLTRVARSLLPWIDGLFVDGNTGPVPLRPGEATIELLLSDRPRHRPEDADEEVLDVAHDVRHLAGRVKIMTGDTAMRVRAKSEGLDVLVIPDGWRRPQAPDPASPDPGRTPV
jgi:predicted ribonuclease YlaK